MNRFLHTRWTLGATVVLACALHVSAKSQGIKLDGYAARVNDKVITVGDVMEFIQPAEQQLAGLYSGSELDAKRQEAFTNGLATLIDRSLIVAEFNKQGGAIPERLINDRVNEFIYDRFGNDRSKFLTALSEQQITLEDWREQVKERLIISILRRQEVTDRVKVSPRLIRETYDARADQYRTDAKMRLSMIMLNKGDTARDAEVKRTEAEKILEQLKSGEDFAEIAKASSEGIKASEGGDMGWNKPEDLRSELAAAVANLKPGEISGIVETDEEWYILKLVDQKDAGMVPFEEVRKAIEDELKQQEGERLYKAWTERLRRKYYVQVFETTL